MEILCIGGYQHFNCIHDPMQWQTEKERAKSSSFFHEHISMFTVINTCSWCINNLYTILTHSPLFYDRAASWFLPLFLPQTIVSKYNPLVNLYFRSGNLKEERWRRFCWIKRAIFMLIRAILFDNERKKVVADEKRRKKRNVTEWREEEGGQ